MLHPAGAVDASVAEAALRVDLGGASQGAPFTAETIMSEI
jgi:hypothetical protein